MQINGNTIQDSSLNFDSPSGGWCLSAVKLTLSRFMILE